MSDKKPKNEDKEKQKPRVNQELEGFDIVIDSFGEIKTSFDIEKINHFLNNNVDDKKLLDRKDLDEIKKGGKGAQDPKRKKKKKR